MRHLIYAIALLSMAAPAPTAAQQPTAIPVTTVAADKNPTKPGAAVTFTAVVERKVPDPESHTPAGAVQLFIDGIEMDRIELDARGQASWTTKLLELGTHRVTATYTPFQSSSLLPSTSGEVTHTVKK